MDSNKFFDTVNKHVKEIIHEDKEHLAYLAGIWYALLIETMENDDFDPADWWKNNGTI